MASQSAMKLWEQFPGKNRRALPPFSGEMIVMILAVAIKRRARRIA